MSRSGRSPTWSRIAPDLLRLGGYRSVYSLVSKFIKDERLRIVFSFHPLLIGGNPFTASAIYTLIPYLERQWGVHFAMGGTGQVVPAWSKLIEGQGGTIRTQAEVEQILVAQRPRHRRRLASGETIAADIVVSNADSAWTYRKLLPPEARRRWTDRRLDRASYSMGLFVWYFGTDRRYEDVAHHTILLGPRYRELLQRHIQAKGAGGGFLAVSASSDGDRSVAGAARLRCVLRAVSGAEPRRRHGLADGGRTVSAGDRGASVGDAAAGSGAACRDARKLMTPLDFQDRLCAWQGARSVWSRCCCKAPGSVRTIAARTSPACILSAPARIRAPVCRAFCHPRKCSIGWCHMPLLSDPPPPTGRRAERCCAADRRVLTRQRSCCHRRCATLP